MFLAKVLEDYKNYRPKDDKNEEVSEFDIIF